MNGIELILEERRRQIIEEGWAAEHDKQHSHGELAMAAVCYAFPASAVDQHTLNIFLSIRSAVYLLWPWHPKWWKPTPDDRIRELAKAGALIAAEIDRIQGQNNLANKTTLK